VDNYFFIKEKKILGGAACLACLCGGWFDILSPIGENACMHMG
jgi:hypothetical protein